MFLIASTVFLYHFFQEKDGIILGIVYVGAQC